MFDAIISTLAGTPLWVWAVLCYLIYVGIKARHTRVVFIPKLFIIPSILLFMKYKIFLSEHAPLYISFIFLGLFIGFILSLKAPMKIFQKTISVELPGSAVTLVLLLSFFAVKYTFGYLHSAMPEVAEHYKFIDLAISGTFTGYFLGQQLCFLYRWHKEKTV
jgi:hypothetical protein